MEHPNSQSGNSIDGKSYWLLLRASESLLIISKLHDFFRRKLLYTFYWHNKTFIHHSYHPVALHSGSQIWLVTKRPCQTTIIRFSKWHMKSMKKWYDSTRHPPKINHFLKLFYCWYLEECMIGTCSENVLSVWKPLLAAMSNTTICNVENWIIFSQHLLIPWCQGRYGS